MSKNCADCKPELRAGRITWQLCADCYKAIQALIQEAAKHNDNVFIWQIDAFGRIYPEKKAGGK